MSLAKVNSHSVTEYPYPNWNKTLLLSIDNAIKEAWNIIKKDKTISLSSSIEEKITESLELTLTDIMDDENKVSGFSRAKLAPITRGSKYSNYNNEHLEKQPDLSIKMIDCRPGLVHSTYDGLFIECKIIDNYKSPRLYIENGIRRYVDGEYAWAMKHSLMIAYVRNNKTLPEALKKSFKNNSSKNCVSRCLPLKDIYSMWNESKNPKTYKSTHSRSWSHLEYGKPDNIEISHIWLTC